MKFIYLIILDSLTFLS